jgi:uncharacterized protein
MRSSRMTRRLLWLAAVVVVGWVGSSGLVAWGFLGRRHGEHAPVPPEKWTDLRLHTTDGESLGAWQIQGDPDKPLVIVLHGHGGSRFTDVPIIELLERNHDGVLAVTQRAHGDSTGRHCDVGWSARHDVVAAVDFVERSSPGKAIVIFGTSMGAASAVFAAKELGHRVRAYVLDSPYLTLDRATELRLRERLPPPFDFTALIGLRLWAPAFLDVPLAEVSPLEHLRDIPSETPVLLMRGAQDATIPAEDFQKLVAALGTAARVVQFPNSRHTEAIVRDRELYEVAVSSFLNSLAPLVR